MKTRSNQCHALGCKRSCARKVFMCSVHWRMVSLHLRSKLTSVIVTGNDEDMFILNLERAIQEVAEKEGL